MLSCAALVTSKAPPCASVTSRSEVTVPKSADPYQDIIELQPPRLPNHPPMSRTARAAQFMPFKALEPHEANIQAVEAIIEQKTDTYIEFDEIYPDF